MACGIYKVKNEITGKIYIGQAVNIIKRWKQHINNYDNQNEKIYDTYFYRSIRKHGIENFSFSIVELCNQNELNEKETKWINYYDSYHNGYNSTLGGDGNIYVDREEFKKFYIENDVSVIELANHFKIDRSTAGRILKELGIKANYYVSDELKKKICEEYTLDQSISCLSLSKKYNKDPETISRILKENNIKVLPSGSPKAQKIIVYDAFTNEVLIQETYIKDFMEYLKANKIVENPSISTIYNHINRNGYVLYGRYKVRRKE